MAEAALRVKPKLRGVFHEFAFFAAVGIGIPLVLTATPGKARLSAIVFASCVAACFGASALYHRPTWQPRRALVVRAARPRRDLPADRRDIHPVLPAGALPRLGRSRADDHLDGRNRGHPPEAVLAGPAKACLGGDRPRARLGRGRRVHAAPQAAHGGARAPARRGSRLHPRRRRSTRAAGPIRSRGCWAITRFSTG